MYSRNPKRVKQEEEYRKVCNELDQELKDNGNWRCFFTNSHLPDKASHHHLRGRTGSLLTDKQFIVPVLDNPHLLYHDMSVDKLSQLSWYPVFLENLRRKSETLYQKEIDKTNKT